MGTATDLNSPSRQKRTSTRHFYSNESSVGASPERVGPFKRFQFDVAVEVGVGHFSDGIETRVDRCVIGLHLIDDDPVTRFENEAVLCNNLGRTVNQFRSELNFREAFLYAIWWKTERQMQIHFGLQIDSTADGFVYKFDERSAIRVIGGSVSKVNRSEKNGAG